MNRWLLAVPLSLVSVLGLFSVMAALVNPSRPPLSEPSTIMLNVLVAEPETDVEIRNRLATPIPEQTLPAPSLAFDTPMADITPTSLNAALPDIALDMSVQGLNISLPVAAPGLTANSLNMASSPAVSHQAAVPLVRVEAEYPQKALKRRIEGYVIVEFTINEKGRPEDIVVIDAAPKRVFEHEAVRAIKRWKYAPKLVEGKAVPQRGQTVKLEFTLAK